MRTKTKLAAVLLAALMGAAACSDDESPTSPTPPTTTPPAEVADVRVRVAHLSPDAPAVDVLVNGDVVLTGVPYKAISDYLDLSAGEYRIQVTPAGQNDISVIDATVTLTSGNVYTVAATGFLADIQPLVLLDDLGTSSNARLRPVHASPDAPAVDIAVKGGDVLVYGLTFRAAGPYLEVPAGSYDLEVRLAGTDTVALSIDGLQLSGGTTSTAFVVGSAAGGTLEPIAAQDAP
jgi:hypothetical protein